MSRPIWKGQIAFGLVGVPVELHAGERREDSIHLNLIDRRNKARVKYERTNAETGEPVPWGEIVKGYEYEEGRYVLLSDEDLKKASPEASQTVEIDGFVDAGEIPVRYFDKPYVLLPGRRGEKPYALLREALRESGKVGIARVVIRSREHLAAVMAEDDALVLMLLRFANELRDLGQYDLPAQDPKELGIEAKELRMARQLVESMGEPFEPAKYHDRYHERLRAYIDEKVASGETDRVAKPGETPEPEDAPAPIPIAELLRRSVEERKKSDAAAKTSKKTPRRKAG